VKQPLKSARQARRGEEPAGAHRRVGEPGQPLHRAAGMAYRGKVRSQEGLLPCSANGLVSGFCSMGGCRWQGENRSSRMCRVVLLLCREAWLGGRKPESEGGWL